MKILGRTIPSFRIALAHEEASWKSFRAALDRKDRACFDRLFLIARLYISACMMACRPVRTHLIMMAVIFHHYKQLQAIVRG